MYVILPVHLAPSFQPQCLFTVRNAVSCVPHVKEQQITALPTIAATTSISSTILAWPCALITTTQTLQPVSVLNAQLDAKAASDLVCNRVRDVKLWLMVQVTISRCSQLFAVCLVIPDSMVSIINATNVIELAGNVQLIQHVLAVKV